MQPIPLTKAFTIEHEGMDGVKVVGQFSTKKLTMMEKVKVGVIKSRLTSGLQYDLETRSGLSSTYDDYAEAIAHCQVALTEKPAWFDPENITDDSLLFKVYKEVADLESAIFRKILSDKSLVQAQDQGNQPQAGNVG